MGKIRVQLLISRGGPAGVHQAGDVIKVSTEEAARMIAAKQARPVRSRAAPERAVAVEPKR